MTLVEGISQTKFRSSLKCRHDLIVSDKPGLDVHMKKPFKAPFPAWHFMLRCRVKHKPGLYKASQYYARMTNLWQRSSVPDCRMNASAWHAPCDPGIKGPACRNSARLAPDIQTPTQPKCTSFPMEFNDGFKVLMYRPQILANFTTKRRQRVTMWPYRILILIVLHWNPV